MSTTIPTPDRVNRRDRSAELTWYVGDPTPSKYGRDNECDREALTVSVRSLHPERKGYVTTVSRETHAFMDGRLRSVSFGVYDGSSATILVTPAARFSAKTLTEMTGAAQDGDTLAALVGVAWAGADERKRASLVKVLGGSPLAHLLPAEALAVSA